MTTLAGLKSWCKKHLNDERVDRLSEEQRDALKGIDAWIEQYPGEQYENVIIDAVFSPHVIGSAADVLEKDRYTAILFGIWGWKITTDLHMQPLTQQELEKELIAKQRYIQTAFDYTSLLEGIFLLDIDNEGNNVLNLAKEKSAPQSTIKTLRSAIHHAHIIKKDMLKKIQDCISILHRVRHEYETSLTDIENIRGELLIAGENGKEVKDLVNTAALALGVVCQIKIHEQCKNIDEANLTVEKAYRNINSVYLQETQKAHESDDTTKELLNMLRDKMDALKSEIDLLTIKYDHLSHTVSEMEDMLQAADHFKMLKIIETIEMNLHDNPALIDPHNAGLKAAYDNCMAAFDSVIKKH